MSRGWIIGIVGLAIIGSSNLHGWAQEGRPKNSVGLSFSERLATLRETFRLEKQSAKKPQNASQGSERKANTAGTSAQANGSDSRYRRNTQASKKRVGGISGGKLFNREGRYPSPPGGTNPSEADRPREETKKTIQVASAEDSMTKRKSSRRSKTTKQAAFDVHEALVGSDSSISDFGSRSQRDKGRFAPFVAKIGSGRESRRLGQPTGTRC